MRFLQQLLLIIPLFAALGAIAAPADNCVVPPSGTADDMDIGMFNVYASILFSILTREI